MLWAEAVPVVTSMSTVALYLAYSIPIYLAWRARRAGSNWPAAAVWSLGRFGGGINLIAILYAAFICLVLVMPPNLLAGKTLLGLLAALCVLYLGFVRRHYAGPQWSHPES